MSVSLVKKSKEKVTKLDRVGRDQAAIIVRLKVMLKHAREGKLKNVMCCGLDTENTLCGTYYIGSRSEVWELLGAIDGIKCRVMDTCISPAVSVEEIPNEPDDPEDASG